MTERTILYQRVNRKTPVIPFRCPTPDHHQQVKAAAAADGLSVSEWVRRAVSKALEKPVTTAST